VAKLRRGHLGLNVQVPYCLYWAKAIAFLPLMLMLKFYYCIFYFIIFEDSVCLSSNKRLIMYVVRYLSAIVKFLIAHVKCESVSG